MLCEYEPLSVPPALALLWVQAAALVWGQLQFSGLLAPEGPPSPAPGLGRAPGSSCNACPGEGCTAGRRRVGDEGPAASVVVLANFVAENQRVQALKSQQVKFVVVVIGIEVPVQ